MSQDKDYMYMLLDMGLWMDHTWVQRYASQYESGMWTCFCGLCVSTGIHIHTCTNSYKSYPLITVKISFEKGRGTLQYKRHQRDIIKCNMYSLIGSLSLQFEQNRIIE